MREIFGDLGAPSLSLPHFVGEGTHGAVAGNARIPWNARIWLPLPRSGGGPRRGP